MIIMMIKLVPSLLSSREQNIELDSCSMLLVRKRSPIHEESKPLDSDVPLDSSTAS